MSSNNSIEYPSVQKIENTLTVFYESSTKEETESMKKLTFESEYFKRKPKTIFGIFKEFFLLFLKFLQPNKSNFIIQIFIFGIMSIPVYLLTRPMDIFSRILIWIPLVFTLLMLGMLLILLCGVLIVFVKGKNHRQQFAKEPEFSKEVKGRKVVFEENEINYLGEVSVPYSEITEASYNENFLHIWKDDKKDILFYNIKLEGMIKNERKMLIEFLIEKGNHLEGFSITRF